jgi:hypothetical protein
MKRIVSVAAILLSTVFASLAQSGMDYKTKGAPLPPFSLEKANGSLITNKVLQKGKPVLLMIFSPQCDHCEHTIDSLRNMPGSFAHMQLLLVTEARNKPELKGFLKKTGLDASPAFRNLGLDKSNLIPYIYTYQLLPQFNIYDAKHKLVKSFAGNFPLDSLRMFIH